MAKHKNHYAPWNYSAAGFLWSIYSPSSAMLGEIAALLEGTRWVFPALDHVGRTLLRCHTSMLLTEPSTLCVQTDRS
jgi:hypothetical protein